MQFRLTYDGPLYSGQSKQKNRDHVHSIRRAIHVQMKELWSQQPLNGGYTKWWDETPKPSEVTLLENRGAFNFIPLVSDRNHLLARLDILLLRPAPPGHLINHGGDLDNRLKTFLDALRIPSLGEIPEGRLPAVDESPYLCLLSDDKLVASFSVDVDRLLRPGANDQDVLTVAKVTLGAVIVTWDNSGLVSMGMSG